MKKDDIVKIPINLTSDPYNKRGEKGKVVNVLNRFNETIVTVLFNDNTQGFYFEDALIVIKEQNENT